MKLLPFLSCLAGVAALSAQSPEPGAAAAVPTPTSLSRVVFDQPLADGPLWACGNAWKASFDARGFTTIPFCGSDAPQNFPLRLEVVRATVGGTALGVVDGRPERVDARVVTDRGAFTEVVDTGLDHLEQSFVFDQLPDLGAIAVDVRIGGEGYAPGTIDGGLRFTTEFGHVDYTKAVAVDAAGRRLPLAIEWTGAAAHIEIPAEFVAAATLPIVLDPTLNYWFALGNPSLLQHDGDVATIQASGINGRTLLIWQRQWSLTDQDCWGLMFDNDLGLVLTDFTIDFTAEDWLKVACAGNNHAQNFLVVSEVRIGLQWFIAGRTITVAGVPGLQFNIEREGVVGTPGNNYHPDVGGDPSFAPGRYTIVFNKKTLGVSDIYMRQVTPAGGLVTANAVLIADFAQEEVRPSISKSCGHANAAQNFLVTWQRTWAFSPFDQEVWGRYVSWNGALATPSFAVGFTVNEETAPAPSSPIDDGTQRLWPVCYEIASAPGQPRDVVGRLLRGDGSVAHAFTVSNGVPGADDRDPEMDADGTRFVTVLTTGFTGSPQSIEVVTQAWLPSTTTVRVEERSGMQTSGLDSHGQGNITAEFSGGNGPTARYKVAFTHETSNTLQLHNYGGYPGGNQFGQRPTQCGSLGIAASGSSVLGQTVTITVANGAASGTVAGFPLTLPLLPILGCNCILGVNYIGFFGNPFSYTIPNDPLMVGTTFSVQGFTVLGSSCLGSLDFSDTIDFTIR